VAHYDKVNVSCLVSVIYCRQVLCCDCPTPLLSPRTSPFSSKKASKFLVGDGEKADRSKSLVGDGKKAGKSLLGGGNRADRSKSLLGNGKKADKSLLGDGNKADKVDESLFVDGKVDRSKSLVEEGKKADKSLLGDSKTADKVDEKALKKKAIDKDYYWNRCGREKAKIEQMNARAEIKREARAKRKRENLKIQKKKKKQKTNEETTTRDAKKQLQISFYAKKEVLLQSERDSP
jgi:hypothetical protein